MQYQIIGEPMPVVQCELQQGESMLTERGSMVWMTGNMKMSTGAGGGGLGKMFGRMISGESIFQNTYKAEGGAGMIAFGSSFPGSIRPIVLNGNSVICQKSAFLASEPSVQLSMHFNKKFGAGLLGGEGFVMQKLTGTGTAFIEIDGFAVDYELAPGQTLIVNPGNVAMMDESVRMDVQSLKGVKNVLFGGEDWFQICLTGPGKVVLQTMTISGLASSLSPFFKTGN